MNKISHLRERLEQAFGYKRFRSGQSKACRAALNGRDTLILMPTGSGKSCLQQLASRGLVAPAGRGRWRLLAETISRDITDRLAEDARRRAEDRQIALRQMVAFAQQRSCRWSTILAHFDEEATTDIIDCRCDVCTPEPFRSAR